MSNVFTFKGRIGSDAETKYTKGGSAVCSFSVANDIGYGDKKQTQWIRVSIFGKRAESGLVQYLTKGQEVFVSGELKLNEYESKGEKRASLEVAANIVDLAGGRQSAKEAVQRDNDQYGIGEPHSAVDDFEDRDIPF